MTIRDTICRFALVIALLASLAAPAAAAAPEGVSPGSQHRLAPVEVRCPTFSWGMVPGTTHYEVVAYDLPDPEEVAPDVELQLTANAEVLYTTVPGSATSWTPSADMCLAPGGRFVWFVRSIAATEYGDAPEPGEWSEGLFFTVMNLPSRDRAWDLPVSGSETADRLERRARATDKGPIDDPWVLVSGDVMTGPLGVEADGINILSQVTRNDELAGNVTKLEVRSDRGAPLYTVDSEGDVTAASLSVGGSTVVDADGDWVGSGDTLPCAQCVDTADIADNAITTSKIANGTITTADLHDNIINHTKILDGTIKTVDLADDAVTADKIALGAVNGVALANGSVASLDLADGAVTSSKIASGAVSGSKIANGTVTTHDIADGTITADDISPSGGVYASRSAVYKVVDSRTLTPGGMTQYHVWCNDAKDLPLAGGCHAPIMEYVNLEDAFPSLWEDPSQPAGYGCTFFNSGSSSYEVRAIIYCIDVP